MSWPWIFASGAWPLARRYPDGNKAYVPGWRPIAAGSVGAPRAVPCRQVATAPFVSFVPSCTFVLKNFQPTAGTILVRSRRANPNNLRVGGH